MDPADWSELRALGHRMIDDCINHLADQNGPIWRSPPQDAWRERLPRAPTQAAEIYQKFRTEILPFALGNTHPGFMGWVHGGGNAVGMLAELLAGCLNANLGGRDHAPIHVERQVIAWSCEMLGLPPQASGLLVTGTSIANFIAVLMARRKALGAAVRRQGIAGARLVAYTSAAAHSCIPRAMDMAGLGTDALRLVPCDDDGRLCLEQLAALVQRDVAAGAQPFLVVGTAGTVDTGAIDRLDALADFCAGTKIWFHVDGAFGALAALSPRLKPLLAGIERADSVAFDFHKWAQVPYDCGCILTRDPAHPLETFANQAAYLRPAARGMAAGAPWPCDLGPDLSRGFRALKVWMTLLVHGADCLGAVVEESCRLAQLLGDLVLAEPQLELLAPVRLNIVCFRVRAADAFNAALVADLQEAGVAAPSTTVIDGKLAIRAAIVNHRTREADVRALVAAVLARCAQTVGVFAAE